MGVDGGVDGESNGPCLLCARETEQDGADQQGQRGQAGERRAARRERTPHVRLPRGDEFEKPRSISRVQAQAVPGNAANAKVTHNDTAPTTDRYDFAAIEVLPAAPGHRRRLHRGRRTSHCSR